MTAETVLAEVMTEVTIAELPPEEEPEAILDGLRERGWDLLPVGPRAYPPLPKHLPGCPELYEVTPGRDTCCCPRPRPDEPGACAADHPVKPSPACQRCRDHGHVAPGVTA